MRELTVAEIAANEERRQNTKIGKPHQKYFLLWIIISVIITLIIPHVGILCGLLVFISYFYATKDDMSAWRRREQRENPKAWSAYERAKAYEGIEIPNGMTISTIEYKAELKRHKEIIKELENNGKITEQESTFLFLPMAIVAGMLGRMQKEDPEYSDEKQYPVDKVWMLRLIDGEQNDMNIVKDKITRCCYIISSIQRCEGVTR